MARARPRRRRGRPDDVRAQVGAGELGVSLVAALLVLMLGTLLVPPLLTAVRTATQASNAYHAGLQSQYATDAAVEYVLSRLLDNPGYRGWVRAHGPSGITTQLPETVNGLQPHIQVAVVERLFDYAVWGDSQTCSSSLDWTGAMNELVGNAHSNAGIKISGVAVTDIIEYVGTAMVNESSVDFATTISNPVHVDPWHLPEPLFVASDYRDPAAVGTPAYHASPDYFFHHSNDLSIGSDEVITTGIHYVEGDLHISGNTISGTATFLVDGLIEMNGTGIHIAPFADDLIFFSTYSYPESTRCSKWVIKIVGNDNDVLDGWIYAPGGLIEIRGSGSLAGSFVGDSVVISGSSLRVEPAPTFAERARCETVDIVAWTSRTRTRARCRLCYETGQVEIISWKVEAVSP
jgi:hypothetical protein